ncbi:hypothetical protein [Prochlorococcus marinus]|uniref:DUF3104 domain-containing protein n=1 Tax=Prochlorococcus marinus XMU1408 TaxID=2213228 RepID=A0A318R297_PROMR|nr:hypothetical protein [Prochlorococcus marinus]MBW3042310.1 hypothetical protein [Prochlorococcus marinus str. XMU1408]PYE01696.1 hypothetical protein DNJ73_06340 [Prochlorococcus marinus XMU1408]
MKSSKSIIENPRKEISKNINQGDCVYLKNQEKLFQVLGIDNSYEKCWVREWPLNPNGSPVFEISIKQIYQNC